jgi:hypothetical protein
MRLLILVIFFSASSSVFGLTLKEKKFIKEWDDTMEVSNKLVKEKCGKDIKASMDHVSWVKEIPNWLGRSMVQGCVDTMANIAEMCGDADAKAAIIEKIGSLKCFAGTKGAREKMEIVKRVLQITTYSEGTFNRERSKEFLENNL